LVGHRYEVRQIILQQEYHIASWGQRQVVLDEWREVGGARGRPNAAAIIQ
jgi:hypothetical protein